MTDLGDLNHTLGKMNERLGSIKESSGLLTRQMTNILQDQDRIIESNERSAASLLKIQRMMHALVWLVIIITLINIGFLMM